MIKSVQTIIQDFEAHLSAIASLSSSISIDYGVMEKSNRVFVYCVTDLGWSDVGSWGALYTLLEKDESENAISGPAFNLFRSDRNLIKEINPNKKVIVDGLSGYMIADTEDVLMICPLDDENHIKEIISQANR